MKKKYKYVLTQVHLNLLSFIGYHLKSFRYHNWLFRKRASHIVIVNKNNNLLKFNENIGMMLYNYITNKIHNSYCVINIKDLNVNLINDNLNTTFLVITPSHEKNRPQYSNVIYLHLIDYIYKFNDKPIYILSSNSYVYKNTMLAISNVLFIKININNKKLFVHSYPVGYLQDTDISYVKKIHRVHQACNNYINIIEYGINKIKLSVSQNDMLSLFHNKIIE